MTTPIAPVASPALPPSSQGLGSQLNLATPVPVASPDVQVFVDSLEKPLFCGVVPTGVMARYSEAFAVQAIAAWQARAPLASEQMPEDHPAWPGDAKDIVAPVASKSVEDCMRLADEYTRLINHPNCQFARAALEACLTQLLDHQAKAAYALGVLDAQASVQPTEQARAPVASEPIRWLCEWESDGPVTFTETILDTPPDYPEHWTRVIPLYAHPPVAPVANEPVAEVVRGEYGMGYLQPIGEWRAPLGTKLYAHPPVAPVANEPVAWMYWNEPDTQRHFNQFSAPPGSYWTKVVPLYAHPPVQPTEPT